MKTQIIKLFFFYAIICWSISLFLHLLVIGGVDVENRFPESWLLHTGIFIAFVPAIILLIIKKKALNDEDEMLSPFVFFKLLTEEAPKWLIALAALSFLYGIVNSSLSFASETDTSEFRLFSGIWLAFYAISALILYPFRKKEMKE